MAWPWLLPWASELSCRCGTVHIETGQHLVQLTVVLAGVMTAFYTCSELSWMLGSYGFTASASSADMSQSAGCLPNQAVFGGHFKLDKADLEETGRAVFVPAQPRKGLYIGAGLASLGHLLFGMIFLVHTSLPPWLLLGTVSALLGRWFGQLPPVGKSKEKGAPTVDALLWRREGPRLACRFGELVWLWFCVLELQRCETSASWSATCG
eukprot:TRINITY_DN106322_c0_g1_i1.p1 TRINITY_DN106322_c0_g1~~TRINITY_DN106322_c0_g1_i1.p1  ORF type:complete len:239 (-),score=30.20 TRINITY_DN106322_c0_g1_i1:17-643(-)